MPHVEERLNRCRQETDLISYVTIIIQALDYFKANYTRMSDPTRTAAITNLRQHLRSLYNLQLDEI